MRRPRPSCTSTGIRWCTAPTRSSSCRARRRRLSTGGVAAQHVRAGSPPARPRGQVRVAEQRHVVCDRAAGHERRSAPAAHTRHRRPLLRPPVRGRLVQQLRLRRPPLIRNRGGGLAARPGRLHRRHPRGCDADRSAKRLGGDRRPGPGRRRGRPACRARHPGPVHAGARRGRLSARRSASTRAWGVR